ncbi:hypothetical protein Bbelb_260080 [Branchiostoma belcheri]|nr:hypothetical protein Bbelb_260080 [Branchiostoma belcheri]
MGTESTAQREQIFSLLVEAGATVNEQDIKGHTPLHFAVMEKDTVVARLLLQHHARVDIPNREGMTPLHMAARARDVEMCRLLTDDTGVDSSTVVNLAANDGTTPLHAAIMSGATCTCTSIVNFLIEKGADLTATKHHLTPLHLAAEYGLIDIVKLLVEAGADINAETPNTGLTPLDMAEHRNRQDVIDYLTERQENRTICAKTGQSEPRRDNLSQDGTIWAKTGQSAPRQDNLGQDGTFWAKTGHSAPRRDNLHQDGTIWAKTGQSGPRRVKKLLFNNCTLDHQNCDFVRNLELVKKLLQDCGADVNAANDAALTPLHFIPTNDVDYWGSTAKAQVKPEMAQLLLKAGAEVNALDGKGQTPLHRAVIAKDLVFTNLLLKAGADVNLRDGERKTPLHRAVTANYLVIESTQILLENGARVDIADKEGSTALHIAARALDRQLCQLLIQHEGGKTAVNHKACDGATPLHVAIESRNAPDEEKRAVVQLLIDNGADLTSQKHGLTPLHLAAEARRPLDIVKMLVEAGADIRAEALKTGLTPLDMAKHTKNQDVVDYLVARAESDAEEGGRPKRDPPSVEPLQTDTPVEETVEEGAVGGIQKLDIKDEDSSDDDL